MEKKWYAVYTRPRWEKKVAVLLTKAEIENYCPLNKILKQWSDRKKTVEEPVFTSYVFVRVNPKEQAVLRNVDGIINLVYWLGRPAVIRDEEILNIKKFLNQHRNVKIIRERIRVNDYVRIHSGAFSELQAQVILVSSQVVKVLLPSLGCSMTAEIKHERISLIKCS